MANHLVQFFALCRTAVATVVFLSGTAALAAEPPTFEKDVRPFLQQHCFECHGSKKQASRLRYDQLHGFEVEQQHLWTLIHEQLITGEMPPTDRPRANPAQRQRVVDWIKHESAAAAKIAGTGSLRRLNRRELSAALQDLTGLSVDYTASLPGDGKVNGFDTGAVALQDAADSVAQTMQITRRAVEAIRFRQPPSDLRLTADLRETKDVRKLFDSWKTVGASGKVRGAVRPGVGLLIEPKWVGERGSLDFYVPPPPGNRGVVRLKLVVAAVKYVDGVPDPHLWVEVGASDIDYRPITATPDKPQTLVYAVQVDDLAIEPRGLRISLSNKVEIPYAIEGFENEDRSKPDEKIPGGPGLFRPTFDRKKLPPEAQPVPFVGLQQIEIEPDYVASWPPADWQLELDPAAEERVAARQLLHVWMERAWRRPVGAAEQQRFEALFQRLRKGMSFDDALRAVFQSVLMSGSFRYLASAADADEVIAQHAIASRLSFMLVGSPPDEELRRLAAAGKLRDPKILDAQVDRLLDDPRSDRFVRPFVMQWLELGQPITIAMDHIQKQDFRFARYLKSSMQEETISYVGRLLAENRPARELIVSDWTMMNESLALHYGYENVHGGQLRKVPLRNDDPRGGGLLGHAGIQSMLCWMGENWLIYRGAWALRHILDAPPPPPPLEVPELIPSDGTNRGKTFKQLLKQHQQDDRCSVCHKTIDPLGFAFQNFDVSGRWRVNEYEKYETSELDGKIAWRGVGKRRPVDTVGQLPRGEEFTSFAECKKLIVEHYSDDLAGGLLKNFMLYATGRVPDVDDLAEIKQIAADHRDRGFPLRDLLKAVVRSKAFLDH